MQENEAVQEEKKKQLYEEGIDAILARAEVSRLALMSSALSNRAPKRCMVHSLVRLLRTAS